MVSIRPRFPSFPFPFPSLWDPFQTCQLQLVSPVTLMFHSVLSTSARSKYFSLVSLSLVFTFWSAGTPNSTTWQILFLLIIKKSNRLTRIRWSVCISTSWRILCALSSKTDPDLCMYIWSYGQIINSCTIPSGSLPPIHTHTLTAIVSSLKLLLHLNSLFIAFVYYKSFCLYNHITYTCYSVAYYWFSL